MNMLVEAAQKKNHGVQYILITPQNVNHVHLGVEDSVIRLRDPERRQATLNFG